MSTITVNQRAFTEALMLAIVAPDEEKSKKARDLASLIGTSLSETEQSDKDDKEGIIEPEKAEVIDPEQSTEYKDK